jgi:hypothetical protein
MIYAGAAAAVAVRDGAADFADTQLAVHLHYSPFELECPRILYPETSD